MGILPVAYEPVFGVVIALLSLVAIIEDVRRLTIPNWISIALVVVFLLYVTLSRSPPPLLAHILVAGAVFALGTVFFVLGWFGGGDVKLFAAVSLWAGPAQIQPLVVIMSLIGAVLSLLIMALRAWLMKDPRRAERLPFAALAIWAEKGVCPYGIAIGTAALLTLPVRFF